MKITLEPTTMIVHLNGVPTRIWQGQTAKGVPISAFVALVAVDRDADTRELEEVLRDVAAPRPELLEIPARLVLG